jgi:hypothetical protein
LDSRKINQLGKNFNKLHEGTRHTVHSSETLNAAIKIITRIQEQQAKLLENALSKLPGKSQSSSDSSPKDGEVPERTQLSSDSSPKDGEVPERTQLSSDSSPKDGEAPERTQLSSDSFQLDEKVAEFLEFQLCKLQNLLLRSQANHERLCSEVSLVRFS